jgi:hypothetical protein
MWWKTVDDCSTGYVRNMRCGAPKWRRYSTRPGVVNSFLTTHSHRKASFPLQGASGPADHIGCLVARSCSWGRPRKKKSSAPWMLAYRADFLTRHPLLRAGTYTQPVTCRKNREVNLSLKEVAGATTCQGIHNAVGIRSGEA